MSKFRTLLLIAAVLVNAQSRSKIQYPTPPKSAQVDDYHGVKIADPYRELENADSPATQKWIEAENELTFSYLKKLPARDLIGQQLAAVWNYERFTEFSKAGSHYLYRHNSGLQNQAVLYVMDSLDGVPRELIDPNTYRKDGTAALNQVAASWSGNLIAYGVAQAGSDWTEIRVRDVNTGKDLPDLIRWTKGAAVAWNANDTGFYYSAFSEPPKDQVLTVAAKNEKVFYHRLGDPQSADKLLFERPDHPSWLNAAQTTQDGRYLILLTVPGVPSQILVSFSDLSVPNSPVKELVSKPEFDYEPMGNVGTTLYLMTTDGAPRGRVIAVNLDHPERANWKDIVPEQKDTLQAASLVGGKILLEYMKDAHSAARLVNLDGQPFADIELPGLGTALWSETRQRDREAFYNFATFSAPASTYRLDVETGKSMLIRKSRVAFNPSDYETEQVFYPSKDGTRIPMFLCHKKGLKKDGQNPTLLYGYGGFSISLTPSFDPAILEWMELGGLYAQANLRGGSEYGEDWHHAGMREHKQNVFDDFIAAAEYLIAENYTSTPKLAITGRSNGGLLVGAVLNQRPDLFGAALPAVGVMDMLRFNQFGFGEFWAGEYGSPQNPDDFNVLRAYSPLHNVRQGVKYPPTLITTADHDDRVMPGHSFKYAATLQAAQQGPAPILIRIETRAGHGAGKPTSKRIAEWADQFAFLANALHMNAAPGGAEPDRQIPTN